MRQKRIRWRDEGFQMTEAWFETWSGGGTLGSREAGLLLDAVAKDAENGDWGVYNWFLADNDADNYDLRIQFEYKLPESQFNRIHDTIRINVKEGMTETIRALKDLKLITDAIWSPTGNGTRGSTPRAAGINMTSSMGSSI